MLEEGRAREACFMAGQTVNKKETEDQRDYGDRYCNIDDIHIIRTSNSINRMGKIWVVRQRGGVGCRPKEKNKEGWINGCK